jgi:aminoglycoside phosphotransferase family enzyme/predicted kinase
MTTVSRKARKATREGAMTESAPLDPLIRGLLRPQAYPHSVSAIRVVETHISWVLLTGEFAYKIKKPLDLGFLDFSTLEKRHQACSEEIRLNSRFAPDIYLQAVPIAGPRSAPMIEGSGPTLEYAVRMRQFPEHAELDSLLASGELRPADMDSAASAIAAVHEAAPHASRDAGFGTAAAVQRPVRENFAQIERQLRHRYPAELERVRRWSEQRAAELHPLFDERLANGFIRECHGDLHLSNMIRLDHRILAFDCIEFNPALRWVDVISDIAFLVMDLLHRRRQDLAYRFTDRYLARSGDYQGVRLLRFYLVYRSMVRAKIAAIRASQKDGIEPGDDVRFLEHLRLADRLAEADQAGLVLMHGLSGSGKTHLSESLVESLPAIRIRSDVERKRLAGLPAAARTGSTPGSGLYDAPATRATYDRLLEAAADIVAGGMTAVVDATFLKRAQREQFRTWAGSRRVPFAIVSCEASPAELERRLQRRAARGTDASEADLAVLEHQSAELEALTPDEETVTLRADTSEGASREHILARLHERLHGAGP